MGLRSLSGAHPAAYWSACVRALPDVQSLLPPDLSTCPAPFMNCIRTAHRLLQEAGLTADAPPGMRELLPPTANDILSFYGTPDSPICNLPPHLQRDLSHAIVKLDFNRFLPTCSARCRARLLSCSGPHAWIQAVTSDPELLLTNQQFQLASRLRLGVPPLDLMPSHCACGSDFSSDCNHFCWSNS